MIKTKLALAVAVLAAGTSAASASTTMYNAYNAYATNQVTDGNYVVNGANGQSGGTDGWTWGKFNAAGAGTANFVGTANSSTTPFGYNGSAVVNWAVKLDSATDSATVSSADAHATYGIWADIDVSAGAWSDNNLAGAKGWKHNIDFGLFKSDVATQVKLTAAGVNQTGTDFGFTIFKGMDTSTVAYGHHGGWNTGNNATGLSSDSLVPGTSFTTADIVAYSVGGATPSNLNSIIFNAEAGQVYTIVMGGYKMGTWRQTMDGYSLSVQAVPVPGAVWLFGSAMAGLIGFGRRKAA